LSSFNLRCNRKSIALLLPLSLCALTLSSAVRAEGGSGEKASAEALFDEGVALVAGGNYSDGCSKFEGSQALEPTLGTELHLADCYERLGKTASAWALFRESEGLAHQQHESDREGLARDRAAALVHKLSYLVIDMAGEPPADFEVRRNGRIVPVASLGVSIPVDPGEQRVTASAPMRDPWSAQVQVAPGPHTVALSIPRLNRVAPKPALVAQSDAAQAASGRSQRTLGITATAVGFAGILGGVGLGLYAKHENDQSRLDRFCPTDGHDGCTSEGANLRQRAELFASASTVTLVASGAVLAAGVLLWSTTPSTSETRSAASVRVSAAGTRDSFQTVIGGTW
jgi:hypothetical protein